MPIIIDVQTNLLHSRAQLGFQSILSALYAALQAWMFCFVLLPLQELDLFLSFSPLLQRSCHISGHDGRHRPGPFYRIAPRLTSFAIPKIHLQQWGCDLVQRNGMLGPIHSLQPVVLSTNSRAEMTMAMNSL